jgi:hypothetical protein
MLKNLPLNEKIDRRNDAVELLRQVKKILLPNLSINESKGYNGSEFIGNTYQIYRTILHKLFWNFEIW